MSNHDFIDAADVVRVELAEAHLPHVARALEAFLSAATERYDGDHSRDAVVALQAAVNRYASWLEAIDWGEPGGPNPYDPYVLEMPRSEATRLGEYLSEVEAAGAASIDRLRDVIAEAEAAIAVLSQIADEAPR